MPTCITLDWQNPNLSWMWTRRLALLLFLLMISLRAFAQDPICSGISLPFGSSKSKDQIWYSLKKKRIVIMGRTVFLCLVVCLCLSVYLSICLSVYLSICLFVCLSVCLSGVPFCPHCRITLGNVVRKLATLNTLFKPASLFHASGRSRKLTQNLLAGK